MQYLFLHKKLGFGNLSHYSVATILCLAKCGLLSCGCQNHTRERTGEIPKGFPPARVPDLVCQPADQQLMADVESCEQTGRRL